MTSVLLTAVLVVFVFAVIAVVGFFVVVDRAHRRDARPETLSACANLLRWAAAVVKALGTCIPRRR